MNRRSVRNPATEDMPQMDRKATTRTGATHGHRTRTRLQPGDKQFTGYSPPFQLMQPVIISAFKRCHTVQFPTTLFTALLVLFTMSNLTAAGKAARVVVVVWDGMRPDFVSETNTPNLFRLSQQGVTFRNHHPVYVSTTEVNGTALATGVYPELSTIIGNKEFRPALNASKKVQTESPDAIRKGDKLTGNHYLAFPTVAELLQGRGYRTAIAGAKGVALLHDRAPREHTALGINLYAGEALPASHLETITARLGSFPAEDENRAKCDLWTTRALIGPLWEKEVPAYSLLWLSEPDHTQHETGPGSPSSLAMVRRSDQHLALVLDALEKRHLRDSTDIIVVSDHAFSTIDQNVDVEATLQAQGFKATRTSSPDGLRAGEIMIVGNGGSVFLYVAGHDLALIEKVTHCLQAQTFCGVVFTRQSVEGAFRLHEVRLNSPFAPDIVLSTRWKADKSENGTPGMIYSDYGQYAHGQGMHGSLSRFDMHNTCIAAGPDFRRGLVSDTPTGNIDIAPTILWILGVEPRQEQSGRVLTEALAESSISKPMVQTHKLETNYQAEDFTWRQYLKYSEVNGVLYFDEGNGEQVPREKVGGS